ncbi:hypothetical protein ACWECC_32810 [Streptomyces microflavus]
MAKLDQGEPYDWARALKGAADDTVASPLWDFPPEARKAVIHERRRRFGVNDDEGLDVG